MATNQFPMALSTTTVHHYCGMINGRYSDEKLFTRIMSMEDRSIFNPIRQTEVLGIDDRHAQQETV